MRKQPRAKVREGRPSSALGDMDHRARKVAVPRLATPAPKMDELDLTGTETASQVKLIETVNRLIRESNQED